MTFSFLLADIVAKSVFGAPALINLQIRGADVTANFAYANQLLNRICRIRVSRMVHSAVAEQPSFNVDVDRNRGNMLADRTRRYEQSHRQSGGRAQVRRPSSSIRTMACHIRS